MGPIKAVVRIHTELPRQILNVFGGDSPSVAAQFNRLAALGSVYDDGEALRIGSRLTIYEAEDAWDSLHLPLLAFTVILGAEPILGGMRRSLGGLAPKEEPSDWADADFEEVADMLSEMCVCTTGDLGLTAEFPLAENALSAIAGHRRTALWRLLGGQPHPETGGGLFCLLQLPHQVADKKRLDGICAELNRMEMAAHDLPPHFGAWCRGNKISRPAYVSFLPNVLHGVPGIATNLSIWAAHRSQWGSAVLPSMGVRL